MSWRTKRCNPKLKSAYRKLVKYHPDKNPNDKTAEEKFEKEVKHGAATNENYDNFGHAAFENGGGQVASVVLVVWWYRFSDIFEDFWRFGEQKRIWGRI